MPDTPIAIVNGGRIFVDGAKLLEHYTSGNLTAAATKYEWAIHGYYRIRQVIVDSEVANAGNGVDRIDVNVNGTSIYSATADKPVLQQGDTGMWVNTSQPLTYDLKPGDIVTYDVDNVGATNGSSRVKVCIILIPR